MQEPKITFIYHHPCSDGFSCAWLFWKCYGQMYPDINFVPAKYGDDIPEIEGHDVWIADFSYPRDVLLKIEQHASSIIVFDHHKTAMQTCEGLEFCYFDMAKCGNHLLWDYLEKLEIIPCTPEFYRASYILSYIEDRDLWLHKMPNTREINAAIRSYPMTFEAWDDMMQKDAFELIGEGVAIQRYRRQLIEQHKNWAETINIAGYSVPAVYCTVPEITSEIAGEMSEGQAFAATFRRVNDGRTKFELRSRGDFDVSEIAKLFGGGGHRNAAGFYLNPNILLEKPLTL